MIQIVIIREKNRGNIKGASLYLPNKFKTCFSERSKLFCCQSAFLKRLLMIKIFPDATAGGRSRKTDLTAQLCWEGKRTVAEG